MSVALPSGILFDTARTRPTLRDPRVNLRPEPDEADETEPPDSSGLFVRQREPEPARKLGDWNPSFVTDTWYLVNLWGVFAILTSIGMTVMLIWPTWIFKEARFGYMTAGWCAFSAAVCAAVAYGFWRRHAWAGVAGVILPGLSALARAAVIALALATNTPVKWRSSFQILASGWLAWMAWQWLKEQREMVAMDAAMRGDVDENE
jgi:hypothetical protein